MRHLIDNCVSVGKFLIKALHVLIVSVFLAVRSTYIQCMQCYNVAHFYTTHVQGRNRNHYM